MDFRRIASTSRPKQVSPAPLLSSNEMLPQAGLIQSSFDCGDGVGQGAQKLSELESVLPGQAVTDFQSVTEKRIVSLVVELETGDPDDILTLLFLLGHPRAEVKAIVMSPGSPDQIGLVRHLLTKYGHGDIPLGAFNLDHPKRTVSSWHTKVFGRFEDSRDAVDGAHLILEHCTSGTTMLCCGPMRNLGKALQLADTHGSSFRLEKVIIQGGFAGDGVVPERARLEKFKGMHRCDSWNLNASLPDSKRILASSRCVEIRMVSKNVCHGVLWDQEMSDSLSDADESSMMSEIDDIMTDYRSVKGQPKAVHDILAACCALDQDICDWARVTVDHRKKSGWGSQLSDTSNILIVTDYHRDQFISVLKEGLGSFHESA